MVLIFAKLLEERRYVSLAPCRSLVNQAGDDPSNYTVVRYSISIGNIGQVQSGGVVILSGVLCLVLFDS